MERLRQKFVCSKCGAKKVFVQYDGMSRTEFFNRLPPQTPCDTKGCDGYAAPEEEMSR